MTAATIATPVAAPARTWPNRYRCTCDTCAADVPRGEGTVRRATRKDRVVRAAGRRWVVSCAACIDGPVVVPAASPAVTSLVSVAVAPAVPVVVPSPAPRKRRQAVANVPDGYTVTSAGVIRCKGCGMLHGGGHYQGCNRPTLKRDGWRKPAVKPGTAAHAKLQASVVNRLGMLRADAEPGGRVGRRTDARAFR